MQFRLDCIAQSSLLLLQYIAHTNMTYTRYIVHTSRMENGKFITSLLALLAYVANRRSDEWPYIYSYLSHYALYGESFNIVRVQIHVLPHIEMNSSNRIFEPSSWPHSALSHLVLETFVCAAYYIANITPHRVHSIIHRQNYIKRVNF